jgi:hypothetical protein
MTGDINHLLNPALSQQFQHERWASGPGRIEDDSRLLRKSPAEYGWQKILSSTGDEFPVKGSSGQGILARSFDRKQIQFNSVESLHQTCRLNTEKAYAAISVYQEARPACFQALPHDTDQLRQEKEIVLEKGIWRDLPIVRRYPEHYLDSPFRRWIASNALYLGVQGRFRDFAFLNVNYQAVIRADEANIKALLEFVPLAANHDPIAVTIRLRTGDHRSHNLCWKSSHPFEEVRYLFAFNRQLTLIGNVLVLAASTVSEITTRSDNTVEGRFENRPQ